LQVLLEHAGMVVTRQVLLEQVWSGRHAETNTLAVHVRRLRRRLGDTADEPRFIESVRGVGYRFRIPDQPDETLPSATFPRSTVISPSAWSRE
jgi:DNA-binding winged helix-turn-helix (wHTH) protein